MLYLGTTPLAGNLKSKLFTSSGTFVVPADVQCVWIDGCSGGHGGGGGYNGSGGGGGGGGAGAVSVLANPLVVIPAETLTLTIGAGGAGGVVGTAGSMGGTTSVAGSTASLILHSIGHGNPSSGGAGTGQPGTATLGGTNGFYWSAGLVAGTDDIGMCPDPIFPGVNQGCRIFTSPYRLPLLCGGSGGGPGKVAAAAPIGNDSETIINDGTNGAGGVGGLSGYSLLYRNSGITQATGGGRDGPAANATGYGNGGGGGGGGQAGGNGSPGFVRIYYISKYTVA